MVPKAPSIGANDTDTVNARESAMNLPDSSDDRNDPRRPPTVSVGVPVYNGERFLRAALESLRSQTFTEFEVVICDNASTDATADIAQDYQQEDRRFRHVRNPENLGLVRNYRRALEIARGQYFKWHSSDDILQRDYLAEMVRALGTDPRAVLCACLMPPIDSVGEPIPFDETADGHISESGERYRVWPAPPGLSDERAIVRFDSAVNELPGNMQGQFYYGLMRTDVVRQLPEHGLYLGAERVLLAELAMRGRWLFIDRPLVRRRIHSEHFGGGTVQDTAVGLDPQRSRRLAFPAAQQFAGYVRALHGVPLSPTDRLRGYRSIARKVMRAGTWRAMFERGPDNYFGWGAKTEKRRGSDRDAQHPRLAPDNTVRATDGNGT